MAETQTASIPVPSDLMTELESYAQSARRSVGNIAEEALRMYVHSNPAANEMRRLHMERAQALGLEMEEYVALQMKEWRREDRELEAHATGRS